MNIKEAVKKTSLTKKAIRYYEEKELITPIVNKANGYKVYSVSDLARLQKISFLRNLGMPVATIKVYLNEPKDRERLLLEFSKTITDKIEELSYAKSLVTGLLKNSIVDYEDLNKSLIYDQQKRKDFVVKRLLKLFPNQFGRYLVLHFGAYLNEPLDTTAKQKAFEEIVEFLDSVEGIEIPKVFLEQISELDENRLIDSYKISQKRIVEILCINTNDEKKVIKLKDKMKKYVEMRNKMNSETSGSYNKLKQELYSSLKASGYYENFIENIKVISKSYREYSEDIVRLGKALGMSYDDRGNIQLENKGIIK